MVDLTRVNFGNTLTPDLPFALNSVGNAVKRLGVLECIEVTFN